MQIQRNPQTYEQFYVLKFRLMHGETDTAIETTFTDIHSLNKYITILALWNL